MFFVTLLMVLMATVGVAQAQTLLYADTVWAKPGENVTVPVMISENPGIAYADLSVTFSNEYMTVTGATKGTVLPGTMITNLTKSGVVLEELTEATVIISGNPEETVQNGTLFSLNFHVKETAKEGLVPVTVTWEDGSLMNANGEEIAAETKEGGVYVPKMYTVNFYVEDTLYDTASVFETEKVKAPQTPKKEDMVFLGWFAENSESAWDFASNVVSEDMTLVAGWAHQPLEVVKSTLYRHNGNVLTDIIVKNFSAPENVRLVLGFFDASGRMLCAVSEKAAIPVDASYTIARTVELKDAVSVKVLAFHELEDLMPVSYAKDRPIADAAKISFLTFGGTELADMYVAKGSKITVEIPEPKREGYTFGGWYKNVNETWNFSEDVVMQDVILQAKWDVATYSVTFVTDGEVYDAQTILHKDKIMRPAQDPEKENHLFNCWYEEVDEAGEPVPFDFDTEVTRDIVLEADFDIHAYYVYFETGTEAVVPEQYVIYMDYAEEPVVAREHYVFDGWFTEETCENKWNFTEMPVEKEMTLYAGWTLESYTVCFETGYGASEIPEQTVSYGGYIVIPEDPTHNYGTFEGWYADEDFEALFDFEVPVEGPVTVYAKWAYEMVTVYFNNEGEITETQVLYGELLTEPEAPTRGESDTFTGWYTDEAQTSLWVFEANKVYGEMTLYAGWKIITYTVTFNVNGGTYINPRTVDGGKTVACPERIPSKVGYEFSGWYADDATEELYDFNNKISKDTTLYAGWTDISHLNYIYFDGGSAEAEVSMDADAIVIRAFVEDITSSAEQTLASFVYNGETVTLSVVASTKTGYVRVGESEISFTLPATALQLTTSYMLKTVDGINWSVLCNDEEVATITSVKTEKEEAFGGRFVVANNADGTAPFVGYIRTMEIQNEDNTVASFDFRIEEDAEEIVSEEESITLALTGTYVLDSVNYTGINDIAYPDFGPGYAANGKWETWGTWCGSDSSTHSAFDNVLTIKQTKNTNTISLSMFDQVYEKSKQRNIYTAAQITPIAFSNNVANETDDYRFVGLGNNMYVRDVSAKRLVIFDKEENAEIGTTYYLDCVSASPYTSYSFGLSTITYRYYGGCAFELYKPVVIDIDAHGLSGYSSQRLNFLVSGR